MKISAVFLTTMFAALFLVGTTQSLEAKNNKHRNRFSLNIGTFLPQAPTYVVAPQPAYVERHVYVNPYGYPMQESVYVHARPQYYRPVPVYAYPAPMVSGFSFGARFR